LTKALRNYDEDVTGSISMSVKSLVKPHPNPLLGKEREQ